MAPQPEIEERQEGSTWIGTKPCDGDRLATQLKTEIVNSASEIEEEMNTAGLDVDPTLLMSYLSALEDSRLGRRTARHVAIVEGRRTVGYIPCYIQETSVFDNLAQILTSSKTGKIVSALEALGLFPSLERSLVCASPEAFYCQIVLDRSVDPSRRREVCNQAVQSAEEVAQREGVEVVAFLNVPSREKDLIDALRHRGYLECMRAKSAYLSIRWKTYDEYLRSFSRSRRKGLKSERRKAQRLGLEVKSISRFSRLSNRFCEIDAEMWRVRGKSSPYHPEYYELLDERMGLDSVAVVGYIDGEIQGFTILLGRRGRTCAFHYAGLATPAVRDSNLYFNICYGYTISRAIRNGSKEVRYGPAALHVKTGRGCQLEDLTMFFKPLRGIQRPSFATLLLYDRLKRASQRP